MSHSDFDIIRNSSRLADLIGEHATKDVKQNAVIAQIAGVLRLPVWRVVKKLQRYGAGYIYTPHFIREDTPYNRAKLTSVYGQIVIVLTDGTVLVRDGSCTGLLNKRKARRKLRVEREQKRRKLRIAVRTSKLSECSQTDKAGHRQSAKANVVESRAFIIPRRSMRISSLGLRTYSVLYT